MEKMKIIISLSFLSIFFSINLNTSAPTGDEYVIGEDGIKRIYVNVWGHVKKSGTYLVYEGVDIITLLSIAGGPLEGADLSKIEIISQNNGNTKTLNLEESINNNVNLDYEFKSYDTIHIKPTLQYYLLENSSVINTILQIINLAVALRN